MTRMLVVTAWTALLLTLAVPAAAQYPPDPTAPEAGPGVLTTLPGGSIAVEGSGFGAGTVVCIVRREGTLIGSGCETASVTTPVGSAAAGTRPHAIVSANREGAFVAQVDIAGEASAGDVVLAAVGLDRSGGVRVRDIPVRIAESTLAAPGATLQTTASTGPRSLTAGDGLLVMSLLLGGLLLLVRGPGRHRRVPELVELT